MNSNRPRLIDRIPSPQKIIGYGVLVFFALVTMIPIYSMCVAALQSPQEVLSFPLKWIPEEFHWETFSIALSRYPFGRYIFNSIYTSVAITILRVVLAVLAGYSLAKYKYPGNRLLFIIVLSTMMIPFEVVMVPVFMVAKSFNWLNTYQGMIIPLAADAFGIFLMRQFFMGIPDAFIEAARIDGASELTILIRIMLPLSWPAVIALAIFSFREAWDLYIWPTLIITHDELRTLTLGIARFDADVVVNYNEIMAVAIVGIIPTALLFFFLQRYFIQGITLSGLKE
ncbi:MAG: carbohydrate ABC transporter permease [Anaerolineales bacterium]|nr:carbohydrate ABC transporter permease [Anaerolineales bacterium]